MQLLEDSSPDAATLVPSTQFDPEIYAVHVAAFDLTDAQKRELLHALWQIMRSFVDRAFGEDATQLARKDGDESRNSRELGAPDVVPSSHCPNAGEPNAACAFNAHALHRARSRD